MIIMFCLSLYPRFGVHCTPTSTTSPCHEGRLVQKTHLARARIFALRARPVTRATSTPFRTHRPLVRNAASVAQRPNQSACRIDLRQASLASRIHPPDTRPVRPLLVSPNSRAAPAHDRPLCLGIPPPSLPLDALQHRVYTQLEREKPR